MASEPLQGRCPHCGAEELQRGFQGRIVCGNTLCERQDAVNSLLTDPQLTEHLIKVSKRHRPGSAEPQVEITDVTLRHPLVERLDDDLFTCELALYMEAGRPELLPVGMYQVIQVDGVWKFEPVNHA